MRIAHFYTLYAAGQWRDPVAEHLWALDKARYDGSFHVGIIGPPERRAEALDELNAIRPPQSVVEADEGWEQLTLAALREWLKDKHSGAVMYAHTKGAHNVCEVNTVWRRGMTENVILNWRECAKVLGRGYDAVGMHWLTPQEFPTQVSSPFFGGTFWMATVKYLRRLPECPMTSRYDAEMWIGLKNPRVLDLFPGWPGSRPYPRPRYGRLTASPALV